MNERKSKIPIELHGFYKKGGKLSETLSKTPPRCAGQRPIEYFKMCPKERFNIPEFVIVRPPDE